MHLIIEPANSHFPIFPTIYVLLCSAGTRITCNVNARCRPAMCLPDEGGGVGVYFPAFRSPACVAGLTYVWARLWDKNEVGWECLYWFVYLRAHYLALA